MSSLEFDTLSATVLPGIKVPPPTPHSHAQMEDSLPSLIIDHDPSLSTSTLTITKTNGVTNDSSITSPQATTIESASEPVLSQECNCGQQHTEYCQPDPYVARLVYHFLSSTAKPESQFINVHESQVLACPAFAPASSIRLRVAANLIHIEPGHNVDDIGHPNYKCFCLAWVARNIGTRGCNAAFDFYRTKNPTVTSLENEDKWIQAQILIMERIVAAQWKAYNEILVEAGYFMCTQGTVKDKRDIFEDDKGHYQPWMRGKILKAIAAAALKAFIEIDMDIMEKPEPSTYLAFPKKPEAVPAAAITPHLVEQISALEVWDHPAFYPCQCKDIGAKHIVDEEIETAQYRLYRGWEPLLEEDCALHRAQQKALNFISQVGQSAKQDIIEDGDKQHTCGKNDKTHFKQWMHWHVEWKCYNARREFEETMLQHPQRESKPKTSNREAARYAEAEEERLQAIARKESFLPDGVWTILDSWMDGRMPYEGCECMVWGTDKIMNEVLNQSVKNTGRIPNDWLAYLIDTVHEATLLALKEIRETTYYLSEESHAGADNAKDHFPEWQQSMIKAMAKNAATIAEKRIKAEGAVSGAAAKAANKDAQQRLQAARKAQAGLPDDYVWCDSNDIPDSNLQEIVADKAYENSA